MGDVIVGLLAIVVGAAFCLRGYLAMRLIIPIWGAFTGFMLGASLVDLWEDSGFLATALGWIVGLVLALVFGLLAYLYYEVCVVIAMAAIGFALGTGFMVAIGVSWSWLIILIGVAVAVVLGFVAIVADLPMAILSLLTAAGGAVVVIAGLMLVFGVIDLDAFDSVATTERIQDSWWWYALFLALTITGMVAQMRTTMELRTSLRESWETSGGRQLRTG
ncbi:MAG TPA: DUF4203 domain-containing protein [Acidimicrobiia bacterium]|jgi:hypothetical protein|nr:DUF4203 domain-containing protein [Acidimicrobiia bacterium]